ncbi:hypothetical protein Bamb_3577 [Burkholderia ambifaria AMMD]|uniref:Uncharacterized protein n=1 Tax=Burkholderia ambifaria (strain ATCC BAA-244 / DSM 16087 / CCUG 44356 / LMG 19182 / AMMD) TaxID=339670 RepID=Q0B9P2_BURCM|nr:hypothetical protein Bamb_3577 [Burkholderia ambifaria AMMD]
MTREPAQAGCSHRTAVWRDTDRHRVARRFSFSGIDIRCCAAARATAIAKVHDWRPRTSASNARSKRMLRRHMNRWRHAISFARYAAYALLSAIRRWN